MLKLASVLFILWLKKFPAYVKYHSNRKVNSKILPTELPLQDNLALENQERALGGSLGKAAPALSAVQFRDAYYEKLDKRVDDWMDRLAIFPTRH